MRHSSKTSVLLAALLAHAACDMPGAETLDAPRILALRTDPAEVEPGRPHQLSALVFAVPTAPTWRFCREAWAPTDPVSCASGAIELGQGNPLEAVLPDVGDGWLAAFAEGVAPAVKRLEAGQGARNPVVTAVVTADGAPADRVAAGGELELRAALDDPDGADDVVVSWYVTAGALDPKRTLASEAATFVAPEAAGVARVIAVARERAGGTAWTEATLTIGGAP